MSSVNSLPWDPPNGWQPWSSCLLLYRHQTCRCFPSAGRGKTCPASCSRASWQPARPAFSPCVRCWGCCTCSHSTYTMKTVQNSHPDDVSVFGLLPLLSQHTKNEENSHQLRSLSLSLSLSLSHTHTHTHTHTHMHTHTHVRTLHTHTDTHTCTKTLSVWRLLLHSSQWWSMPRVLVQILSVQRVLTPPVLCFRCWRCFPVKGIYIWSCLQGRGMPHKICGYVVLWPALLHFEKQHQSQIHTYTCIIAACPLMPTCACRQTHRHLSHTHTHMLLTFYLF